MRIYSALEVTGKSCIKYHIFLIRHYAHIIWHNLHCLSAHFDSYPRDYHVAPLLAMVEKNLYFHSFPRPLRAKRGNLTFTKKVEFLTPTVIISLRLTSVTEIATSFHSSQWLRKIFTSTHFRVHCEPSEAISLLPKRLSF
jgi:hypothetical protein